MCPKCRSENNIESQILASGERQYKCLSCMYIWLAELTPFDDQTQEHGLGR